MSTSVAQMEAKSPDLATACKLARAALKGADPPKARAERVERYQAEWAQEVQRRRAEREEEERREAEYQARAAERKIEAKRERDRRYRERKRAARQWREMVERAARALDDAYCDGKRDGRNDVVAALVLEAAIGTTGDGLDA